MTNLHHIISNAITIAVALPFFIAMACYFSRWSYEENRRRTTIELSVVYATSLLGAFALCIGVLPMWAMIAIVVLMSIEQWQILNRGIR